MAAIRNSPNGLNHAVGSVGKDSFRQRLCRDGGGGAAVGRSPASRAVGAGAQPFGLCAAPPWTCGLQRLDGKIIAESGEMGQPFDSREKLR